MKYLVIWSGGYEEPSYFGTDDLAQAEETFAKWAKDYDEGDTLHLLDLTGDTPAVLRDAFDDDWVPA